MLRIRIRKELERIWLGQLPAGCMEVGYFLMIFQDMEPYFSYYSRSSLVCGHRLILNENQH